MDLGRESVDSMTPVHKENRVSHVPLLFHNVRRASLIGVFYFLSINSFFFSYYEIVSCYIVFAIYFYFLSFFILFLTLLEININIEDVDA